MEVLSRNPSTNLHSRQQSDAIKLKNEETAWNATDKIGEKAHGHISKNRFAVNFYFSNFLWASIGKGNVWTFTKELYSFACSGVQTRSFLFLLFCFLSFSEHFFEIQVDFVWNIWSYIFTLPQIDALIWMTILKFPSKFQRSSIKFDDGQKSAFYVPKRGFLKFKF